MGCCKYSLAILMVLTAYVGYNVHKALYTIPPLPDLPRDQWWGPGSPPKTLDTSIRPFKVHFKSERIANLKSRLAGSDWFTEPLEGIGFQYGFNGKYLKEVVNFWRTKYNFSAQEKKLNTYPQFKTNIQGLDIHYIHISQDNPKKLRVVPLLSIYAWPINNPNIIEELLKPREGFDFVFTIVAPTLPGFGYSQGASRPGLGAAQMSVIMNNLMERLGHSQYFIHGGDWGAEIGAIISTLYPDKVKGLHTNLAQASSPVAMLKHILFSVYPEIHLEKKHVHKLYPLSNFFSNLMEEGGHVHLQATKPDTFGVALQDSPVALAAFFLEKFSTGSNKEWSILEDGGLSKNFCLTSLLDNVMVYWDSRSITTSMRIYAETFNKATTAMGLEKIPCKVPTVVARMGRDYLFFSISQLRERFHNLVYVRDFDEAGHFGGYQQLKPIADEVWKSIGAIESYNKED